MTTIRGGSVLAARCQLADHNCERYGFENNVQPDRGSVGEQSTFVYVFCISCMLVFCFFMVMRSRAKRRTYSVENASVVLHTKVPLKSVDDPAPTICKKVLINKVSNVSVLHSKMT